MSKIKMVTVKNVKFSAKTQLWCVMVFVVLTIMEVTTLNGPNVCMVKQKYNITKRVKYRAPMSVRTYEWCLSIPPRCSKWNTEMRDLTRLETEERTAEVAVCCPGYKMRDVSCVPICPSGKTGHGCSEDCPESKWGPNCVNDCQPCSGHGSCSPITGACSCQDGWQGESCESRMSSTTSTTTTTTSRVEELLTKIAATKPTPAFTSTIPSTTAFVEKTTFSKTTLSSNTRRTSLDVVTTTVSPKTSFEGTTLTSTRESYNDTVLISRTTTAEMVPSPNKSATLESSKRFTETSTSLTPLATNLITSTEVSTKSPYLAPALTTNTILHTSTKKISTVITSTKSPNMTTIKEKDYSENMEIHDVVSTVTRATEKTIAENVINHNLVTEQSIGKITTLTEPNKASIIGNITATNFDTEVTEIKPTQTSVNTILNRTESEPLETNKQIKEIHVEIKTTPVKIIKSNAASTTIHKTTTALAETTLNTHLPNTEVNETTRRPEATIRYFPTTVKFKPKEIWIRPANKGDSELKKNYELQKHRATNKETVPTTPKTIIVSIIPTSVSYTTYKKIALTTASLLSQNMTMKVNKSVEQGITKPMTVLSTTPVPLITTATRKSIENAKTNLTHSVNTSKSNTLHRTAKTLTNLLNTRTTWKNMTLNETKSMTTVILNPSNSVTISSINTSTHKSMNKSKDATNFENVTKYPHPFKTAIKNVAKGISEPKIAKTVKDAQETNNSTKIKDTKSKDTKTKETNILTTESPDDEETFHILTEPEHITAVMDENEKGRSSVDLISVISIAGGIMMAVITVAVVIVMVERCKRPRYEDVRKMNDIHMQVMIDNNDVPPPYVRSIFHTALPDPPSSEKCHYQPISTLDRNLKQFMRPVVVQTISPIMLENFRGILECHYDHLPRRSHDFEANRKHCSIAPSYGDDEDLSRLRPCSIAESTIEALKCEAKLDVIDSTTSEPLYAEIPCWRPPSEHAIEIMNLNGEAVTEL